MNMSKYNKGAIREEILKEMTFFLEHGEFDKVGQMNISEYKKLAIREEILKEMNIFLEHGGKVKVLPKEESCPRQVIGANGKYDVFEDFMNANFADFTEISNR